jgi:hypothetical protein
MTQNINRLKREKYGYLNRCRKNTFLREKKTHCSTLVNWFYYTIVDTD